MSYRTTTWTVKELFENKKAGRIDIPRFQRNIVWAPKQKTNFIDSLKSGFPFGTLLVYEVEDTKHFKLIDGLQRATTIGQYFGEPNKFFSKDSVPPELVDAICSVSASSGTAIEKDQVKDAVERWFVSLDIKSLDQFDESHGFTSVDLQNFLAARFAISQDLIQADAMISKVLRAYIDRLRKDADIGGLMVPVIIFTGDESDLPEVFSRLNKGGQQLSKYEIFAATWSDRPLDIKNADINEKINSRLHSYEQHGYVVDTEAAPSLFDYLYGLGKSLSEKHPILFPTSDSNNFDADSIGFNLTTYCFGMDVVDMGKLPEHFFGPKQDLEKHLDVFEKALFSVIKDVENELRPYLGFRLNTSLSQAKEAAPFEPAHSEFHMVTLIAKAFRLRYPKGDYTAVTKPKEYQAYLARLRHYYLYDLLDDYWAGTGNTKAFQIISGSSSRYEEVIDAKKWNSKLDDWLEAFDEKKEKKRSAQGKDAIVFLQFIYAKLLSFADGSAREYDLDHCVSVKRLRTLMGDDGLPMNHVANIALLPRSVNRGKGERTIYEFIDSGTMSDSSRILEELEKYSLTSRAEMQFVTEINPGITAAVTEKLKLEYLGFLRKRKEALKVAFLATL